MTGWYVFLLIATKVDWRSSNHHVGQGVWTGFCVKAAKFVLVDNKRDLDVPVQQHINRVLAFVYVVTVSTKHCCYGTCSNDSGYASKPEMQGVFFVSFPKFKTCSEKFQRWIRACSREGFEVTSIPRNTYMCSM